MITKFEDLRFSKTWEVCNGSAEIDIWDALRLQTFQWVSFSLRQGNGKKEKLVPGRISGVTILPGSLRVLIVRFRHGIDSYAIRYDPVRRKGGLGRLCSKQDSLAVLEEGASTILKGPSRIKLFDCARGLSETARFIVRDYATGIVKPQDVAVWSIDQIHDSEKGQFLIVGGLGVLIHYFDEYESGLIKPIES